MADRDSISPHEARQDRDEREPGTRPAAPLKTVDEGAGPYNYFAAHYGGGYQSGGFGKGQGLTTGGRRVWRSDYYVSQTRPGLAGDGERVEGGGQASGDMHGGSDAGPRPDGRRDEAPRVQASSGSSPNLGGPPHLRTEDPIAPVTHNTGGTYARADFSVGAQRSRSHRDQNWDPRMLRPNSGFANAEGREGPSGPGAP